MRPAAGKPFLQRNWTSCCEVVASRRLHPSCSQLNSSFHSSLSAPDRRASSSVKRRFPFVCVWTGVELGVTSSVPMLLESVAPANGRAASLCFFQGAGYPATAGTGYFSSQTALEMAPEAPNAEQLTYSSGIFSNTKQ